jgi:pyridoxal phosphate enzyme (YggS family)
VFLAVAAGNAKLDGMEPPAERILANLRDVRGRIAAAAARSGRPAAAVRLVAVTKTVGEDAIRTLAGAGQKDLGENRAQQLRDRAAALADLRADWHMIGRLQRKNAKYVVPAAAMIHSVDSAELAAEIGRRALAVAWQIQNRPVRTAPAAPMPCLLEVNSGEAQKAGVLPAEAPAAARAIAATLGVSLVGLMTLAPLAENPETVRPIFAALRQLLENINREAALPRPLSELSMGMTQDYEVAIEEGATIVRVGTALFR